MVIAWWCAPSYGFGLLSEACTGGGSVVHLRSLCCGSVAGAVVWSVSLAVQWFRWMLHGAGGAWRPRKLSRLVCRESSVQ